jgi:hypothetical protein
VISSAENETFGCFVHIRRSATNTDEYEPDATGANQWKHRPLRNGTSRVVAVSQAEKTDWRRDAEQTE